VHEVELLQAVQALFNVLQAIHRFYSKSSENKNNLQVQTPPLLKVFEGQDVTHVDPKA